MFPSSNKAPFSFCVAMLVLLHTTVNGVASLLPQETGAPPYHLQVRGGKEPHFPGHWGPRVPPTA
ncbi:hypothetical protein CC1G_11015 [Coprinopsis cinerea okayama7|uniref:Uncharacterized protein n=1 Tax=Coprinopsis cinerea (strain Okayama-7 / 130 / ATCC MYA-4618 / FGSC 9003) TaxID=240176 RepID=A8NIQ0_COPC7|nr:hypothetical protein CC1G_11015 [Coprinopsis cinerea okayama7\|eukprot:XP_001834045.1 hypothetical protein CC1G_11015 [Coprinopsis cinerea okayama7\